MARFIIRELETLKPIIIEGQGFRGGSENKLLWLAFLPFLISAVFLFSNCSGEA